MKPENYINHVVLLVDASASMNNLKWDTVKVADGITTYLAQRSRELDQETRVTVYTFNGMSTCVHYDKDVLRLPSIAKTYSPNGNTALVSATLKAIDDLEKTATLYGDHAFLMYVLTDGQENASSLLEVRHLPQKLLKLPDNWTLAVLVPNQTGVYEAKHYGFAPGNIAVWNTDVKGINEVGEVIKQATNTFMEGRAVGIRGTKSLFADVKVDKLFKPTTDKFIFLDVDKAEEIRPFLTRKLGFYQLGSGFYELTKTEEVQAQKQVAILDKSNGSVYMGTNARDMLGLPNTKTRIDPETHPKYQLFIQSTSVNRKLVPGTKLLVLNSESMHAKV